MFKSTGTQSHCLQLVENPDVDLNPKPCHSRTKQFIAML
jgi:hypothetical protein